MKRRAVLMHAATLAGVGALAGCVGDGGPGGGDGTADTETTADSSTTDTKTAPGETTEADATETESGTTARTGTDDDGTTARPEPSMAARSISTTGSGCLGGDQTADVSFGERQVSVAGTVKASDPCHEADFESVTYDADADELTVVVTVVETGADTCVQCIGGIEYDASVSFHNVLPRHVTVVHATMGERTTVATADR